jgi:hypothetical protein
MILKIPQVNLQLHKFKPLIRTLSLFQLAGDNTIDYFNNGFRLLARHILRKMVPREQEAFYFIGR